MEGPRLDDARRGSWASLPCRSRGDGEGAYGCDTTAGAAFYPLVPTYLSRGKSSHRQGGLGKEARVHFEGVEITVSSEFRSSHR